jgi:hypothetical protein
MFFAKDPNQLTFIDAWRHLGPKRRKLLEDSWAGTFREEILPALPVDKFVPYFSESMGRPTKELTSAIGFLVLQQAHDLTDTEAISELAFNIQWQYALNIDETTDAATYMCEKTLWNLRQLVTQSGLASLLFEETTKALAKSFQVNLELQRIDSVHIESNMASMGRIGIFSKTIHKFLVNLKRHHSKLFDELSTDLVDKYLKKNALSGFSLIKPSESHKTLSNMSEDLLTLARRFMDHDEIQKMNSYQLLARLTAEQCNIQFDEGIKPKTAKEISSDSLQNPSDPDASYDGYKGKGYQVQVTETCVEEKDETTLNLVTNIKAEPAHHSDANALIPALDELEQQELSPKTMLADTLYGSDENHEEGKERGVDLISPTFQGGVKKEDLHLNDFEISADHIVLRCPNQHEPVASKETKKAKLIYFDKLTCEACPLREQCPAKEGKKRFTLRVKNKDIRLALRRQMEEKSEFTKAYALRSGVEATMSEYDRLTGVKQLRVRGLDAVRYCAFLKGIGLNLFRATRVRKARRGPDSVLKPSFLRRNRHSLAKIHFFMAILARTLQFGRLNFKMTKIY